MSELAAVRLALDRGEWQLALELLAMAGLESNCAEGLELRARAAYGNGDFEASVSAWEDLHALLIGEGDVTGAAMAAAMVAMFLMMDTGLMAPVRGWLRRAERLLDGHGEAPANAIIAMVRRYDEVAVLFCDIVGFTKYCDSTPPEEVVTGLHGQVSRFEEIAERHRLEKIKTIGDAFMATAGLLVPVENPLRAAVACGLEMVQSSASIAPFWEVRIGVHLGSVVAGITGARQFQFDIWGDTVNMASRLSDNGEPGTVVVTSAQWPMLREHFKGRSLGEVELKGKGRVELVACRAGG